MSELHHGSETELERPPAELDEVVARSLGCTAMTEYEADGVNTPIVTEVENRDTSAAVGVADPERSVMTSPVGIAQERIIKVTAKTAIIEVTRPDGRIIRYQVPRKPVIAPDQARTA